MSRFCTVLALLLLAGCQRESFDERYQSAQHKLDAKSAAIDHDLAAAASDAAAAGVMPSEGPGDAAAAMADKPL
ncbi:MAG: hypothetical protein ACKOOL_14090 [Novosphingobium sp.]